MTPKTPGPRLAAQMDAHTLAENAFLLAYAAANSVLGLSLAVKMLAMAPLLLERNAISRDEYAAQMKEADDRLKDNFRHLSELMTQLDAAIDPSDQS